MDLRHYLFENRIKMHAFANLLGVSMAYVADIKSGKKNPSITIAQKMIEVSNGQITPQDIYPELFETYQKAKENDSKN